MSHPNALHIDNTPFAAEAAARVCRPGTSISIVNNKPPAWVFLDGLEGETGELEPSVAIRVSTSDSPEKHYAETVAVANLTEAVRSHGGQVLEILEEPRLVNERFVTVISRYLPGKDVTPFDYGQAVASMHNGSRAAGILAISNSFDPLVETQKTYDFLSQHRELIGAPFRAGDTFFSDSLLEDLGERLSEQQAIVAGVSRILVARGLQPALLQEDVHFGNVRRDHKGVATLIDLDSPSVGPAEYDLGRARTQWTKHFKDPDYKERGYLQGYRQTIVQQSDPEVLGMTDSIALLRFGTSLISLATRQAQLGMPVFKWLLDEGIRRLSNLDDPEFEWRPLNQVKKDQLAAEN